MHHKCACITYVNFSVLLCLWRECSVFAIHHADWLWHALGTILCCGWLGECILHMYAKFTIVCKRESVCIVSFVVVAVVDAVALCFVFRHFQLSSTECMLPILFHCNMFSLAVHQMRMRIRMRNDRVSAMGPSASYNTCNNGNRICFIDHTPFVWQTVETVHHASL